MHLAFSLFAMASQSVQVVSAFTGDKLTEVQTKEGWLVRDLEEAVLQGTQGGLFTRLLKDSVPLQSYTSVAGQVAPGDTLAAVFSDTLDEQPQVLRLESSLVVFRALCALSPLDTPVPGMYLLCSGVRVTGSTQQGFNPRAGSRLVTADLVGLDELELEEVLLRAVRTRGFVNLRFATA